jgi:hypothetical protein
MDFHTRKALNVYPQNEEPFYHSSAYSPDDMVCEGSDSELTDEELRLKRLRYEDHAQKYMRGCLPILQSARLRGPLEDRSEWSNPWRYHPPYRRINNNESLQARRDVTSADRGANDGLRVAGQPVVSSSMVPPGTNKINSSPWITEPGNTPQNTEQQVHRAAIQASSSNDIPNNKVPAAAYSTLEELREERRTDTTHQNRGVDSQWLKGSYVSKRARWHDPEMETPTPNPQVYNQRLQRKAQGTAITGGPTERHLSSNPLSSFPDIARQSASAHSQQINGLNRTIELSRSVFQYIQPSGQSSISYSQHLHSESGHYAQQKLYQPPSPNHDSSSAFTPGERSTDGSCLVLQADHTPRFGTGYSHVQNTESIASTLSKLPLPSGSTGRKEQNTTEDEMSFVTEVAPSSRNLEEFQFKKRRIRGKLSASAPGDSKSSGFNSQQIANPRLAADPVHIQENIQGKPQNQDTNHSSVSYNGAEEDDIKRERDEEDINEDVLASGPYLQWYEPNSVRESSQMTENSTRFKSSETSQNNVEPSITNTSLSSRTAAHIAVNAEPKPQSSLQKNFCTSSPSSRIPVTARPPQSGNPSKLGVDSQKQLSHPGAQYKVPTPRQILAKPAESAVTDGSSTQSFNTAPARSSGISLCQQSPLKNPRLPTTVAQKSAPSEENTQHREVVLSHTNLTPSAERLRNNIENDANTSPQSGPGLQSSSAMQKERSHDSGNEGTPVSSSNGEQISNTSKNSIFFATRKLKTPQAQSQVLRPSEQSPWTKINVQPLDRMNPMNNIPPIIASTELERKSPRRGSHDKAADSDSQSLDHQTTPENDGIRLFSDMVTPPPPSRLSNAQDQQFPTDTQQIAEAAMNNPWISTTANKVSANSSKRVSFGILSDDLEGGASEHQRRRLGRSPPPPKAIEDLEKEEATDNNMVATGFEKHFGIFKQPKGLPQHDFVSMGSPSVGAMAEAFIAADQDMSIEEERRQKLSETARHLKPSSPSMVNAVRRESVSIDTSYLSDTHDSTPTRDTGHDTQRAGFDMDDALGGFADFLGDWSVEGELQKARNSNQAKSVESNGAKRRRLFGII